MDGDAEHDDEDDKLQQPSRNLRFFPLNKP